MRAIVIGGSGRTGRLILARLVAAGHAAVAIIRNPKHMAGMVKLGAETVLLDLEASTGPQFQDAFRGADAVIFAAGSAAGEPSALDRRGLVKTVRAARAVGVPRYVAIASIGASTGMRLSGEWATDEMRDYYRQKRAANAYLRDAGIGWTIIEPAELTEGKATGKVTLSETALEPRPIARADVAAVLVALLETEKSLGHAYQLTGGTTPIGKAVAAVTSG